VDRQTVHLEVAHFVLLSRQLGRTLSALLARFAADGGDLPDQDYGNLTGGHFGDARSVSGVPFGTLKCFAGVNERAPANEIQLGELAAVSEGT